MQLTTLYHPIGPLGYRRLQQHPEQGLQLLSAGRRYFFPLLCPFQATLIARRWYVPKHGCAWVCHFTLPTAELYPFPHQDWSNSGREEYRIPSDNLANLSSKLLTPVETIRHLTLKNADQGFIQRLMASHSLVGALQKQAALGQKPLPFLDFHHSKGNQLR